MPKARSFAAAACLLLLVGSSGLMSRSQADSPSEDAATPPHVEAYARDGDISGFLTAANAYLTRHPDSPEAPRLTYDLLMVGTLSGNEELVRVARSRLVLLYPQSVSAAFAVTGLEDAGSYRSFLIDLIDRQQGQVVPATATRLCRAVELGAKHHGENVLDDELALYALLLAQISDHGIMEQLARERLAHGDSETHQIADGAFLSDLTPEDRVAALTRFKTSKPARFLQKALFHQLDEPQQQQPHVARAMAESSLFERDFERALTHLANVESAADAQAGFWRVWSAVATGRLGEAQNALDALAESAPQSPWRAAAEQLVEAHRHLPDRMEQYVAALDAALIQLRRQPGAVEGVFEIHPRSDHRWEGYLGLVFADQHLEFQMWRDNEMQLGYRCDPEQWMLYLAGENAVFHYLGEGAFPVLEADLQKQGPRKVDFRFNLSVANSLQQTRRASERLLSSPLLGSREGLRELLTIVLVEKGALPLEVETGRLGTEYRWLVPQMDEPRPEIIRYTISPENRLTAFSTPWLACQDLNYGPASAEDLSPPVWPKAPLLAKEKLDGTEFVRLFAAAGRLLQSIGEETDQGEPGRHVQMPEFSPTTGFQR